MPKVKPYKTQQELDLEREIGAIVFQISRKGLSQRTGIAYSTLCAKLRKVGTLTMAEYWAIQKAGR